MTSTPRELAEGIVMSSLVGALVAYAVAAAVALWVRRPIVVWDGRGKYRTHKVQRDMSRRRG